MKVSGTGLPSPQALWTLALREKCVGVRKKLVVSSLYRRYRKEVENDCSKAMKVSGTELPSPQALWTLALREKCVGCREKVSGK